METRYTLSAQELRSNKSSTAVSRACQPQQRATYTRRGPRWLKALLAAIAIAIGAAGASAPAASAWAWDPHVYVFGSVGSCGPSSTNGWGWYEADNGERGWMSWGSGSTFGFHLYRVPGYGASTLVTIRWGAGNCSAVRYRVISRPAYGVNAGLGYLG